MGIKGTSKVVLSERLFKDVCNTIKLPGNPVIRWYRFKGKPLHSTSGKPRGYGNNPVGRGNRQPSPTDNCLRMQFTD